MTLPTIHDIMSPPNPSALGKALLAGPLVTIENAVYDAKCGNAAWVGNHFTVSGEGVVNYWFVPAIPNKVSYCVVNCTSTGDAYVISDQFGGCELHELYNAQYRQLAFLHVYRGGGATVQYTAGAGWVLRSVKRSSSIAQAGGMNGSNWSVSYINRTNNPPVVQSKFIGVTGSPPAITVAREDNG
jgi:hypothetical protein